MPETPATPFAARFGERVRRRRRRAGLSQEQLARLIPNVGGRQVSRWERGVQFPSQTSLAALCAVFACIEEDLLCCDLVVDEAQDVEAHARAPRELPSGPGTSSYADTARRVGWWSGQRLVSRPITGKPETDRAQSAAAWYALTGI